MTMSLEFGIAAKLNQKVGPRAGMSKDDTSVVFLAYLLFFEFGIHITTLGPQS